jgi:DNA replication and repair protein RecF
VEHRRALGEELRASGAHARFPGCGPTAATGADPRASRLVPRTRCANGARSPSMSLTEISIHHVRCLKEARLEMPAGVTLICGGNGSGKTSILEAIFMLGRGRSFRTRSNSRLITYGQDHLRIIGRATRPVGESMTLGIEVNSEGTAARISGRQVDSLAELSQAFAAQVIEPGVHRLIEEAGHRRRRWLDWAVFHVEPRFVNTWVQYARALKQRNAALKQNGTDPRIWDTELARLGEAITQSRQKLMERLEPYWLETVTRFSGLDVQLRYQRGWGQDYTLVEALTASRSRDAARQTTQVGPHRADVAVHIHSRPAREVLSRGQQKLVATAMAVAQLKMLKDATALNPTLLLDDPAAELDSFHLERFVDEVSGLRCQLVVTSLYAESRLFGAPERTFLVEEGGVHPV